MKIMNKYSVKVSRHLRQTQVITVEATSEKDAARVAVNTRVDEDYWDDDEVIKDQHVESLNHDVHPIPPESYWTIRFNKNTGAFDLVRLSLADGGAIESYDDLSYDEALERLELVNM